MSIVTQSVVPAAAVPLTFKHTVMGFAALSITIVFMVFATVAWIVFLKDREIEYRRYDLLVQLVWDYPRPAAIVTIFLIAKASQNRLAKLAKIGAICLAVLVPGFWIAWGGRLSVSHLVGHYGSFGIGSVESDALYGVGSDRDGYTSPQSKLSITTLVPVLRPDHAPDCEITFNLEDKYADTITRTLHFGVPLDSIYTCGYYSKQGIIADERSGEYVRVPGPFRTWVLNALYEGQGG